MTCLMAADSGIGIKTMMVELDSMPTLVLRLKDRPERRDVLVTPIEIHLHPALPVLPPFVVHSRVDPACARWDQNAASLPEFP